MSETKTAPKAGHVFRTLRTASGKREVIDHVKEKFNKGLFNPVYTDGPLVNHISMDLLTPLSICGKMGYETSTAHLPTLVGVMCPRCISIYDKAFTEWLQEYTRTAEKDENTQLLTTCRMLTDAHAKSGRRVFKHLSDINLRIL